MFWAYEVETLSARAMAATDKRMLIFLFTVTAYHPFQTGRRKV
jgi:hypothetical protein